jgi:hypothetical protein
MPGTDAINMTAKPALAVVVNRAPWKKSSKQAVKQAVKRGACGGNGVDGRRGSTLTQFKSHPANSAG